MNIYFTKVILMVFLLSALSVDLCTAASAADGCAGGAMDTCAPPAGLPVYVSSLAVTPAPSPAKPPSLKVTAKSDSCASAGSGASTCEDSEAGSRESTESTDDEEDGLSVAPASPLSKNDTIANPRKVLLRSLVRHDLPGPEFKAAQQKINRLSFLELSELHAQTQRILRHLPGITPSGQAKLVIAMTRIPTSVDRPPYIEQAKILLPNSRDKVETFIELFNLHIDRLVLVTNQVSRFGVPDRALAPIIRAADYILTIHPSGDLIHFVAHTLPFARDDMDAEHITAILEALSRSANFRAVAAQTKRLTSDKKDMSGKELAQLIDALSGIKSEKLEPVVTATLFFMGVDMPTGDRVQLLDAFSGVSLEHFETVKVNISNIVAQKPGMPVKDKSQLIRAFSKLPLEKTAPIGILTTSLMKEKPGWTIDNAVHLMEALSILSAEHLRESGSHIVSLLKGKKDVTRKHMQVITEALSKVDPVYRTTVTEQTAKAIDPAMSSQDIRAIIEAFHEAAKDPSAKADEISIQFKRLLSIVDYVEDNATYPHIILKLATLPTLQLRAIVTRTIELILSNLPVPILNAMVMGNPELRAIHTHMLEKSQKLEHLQREQEQLKRSRESAMVKIEDLRDIALKSREDQQKAMAAFPVLEARTAAEIARLKTEFEPHIHTLKEDAVTLKTTLEANIRALQGTRKTLQAKEVSLRSKVKDSQQEKATLEKIVSDLTERDTQMQKELTAAKDVTTALEEDLATTQKELAVVVGTLESAAKKSKTDASKLQATLSALSEKAIKTQSALTSAQKTLRIKSVEADNFRVYLRGTLELLETKSAALGKAKDLYQASTEALQESTIQLRAAGRNIAEQLRASSLKIKAAEKDLATKINEAKLGSVLAKNQLPRKASMAALAEEERSKKESQLPEIDAKLEAISPSREKIEPSEIFTAALRFLDHISTYERFLRVAVSPLHHLALDLFADPDNLPMPYGTYS